MGIVAQGATRKRTVVAFEYHRACKFFLRLPGIGAKWSKV